MKRDERRESTSCAHLGCRDTGEESRGAGPENTAVASRNQWATPAVSIQRESECAVSKEGERVLSGLQAHPPSRRHGILTLEVWILIAILVGPTVLCCVALLGLHLIEKREIGSTMPRSGSGRSNPNILRNLHQLKASASSKGKEAE
jgi:hypothetical protein